MNIEIIFFHIILFLISFTANSFSAIAGGGAGFIQLPALILLGLPFPVALATHKIASVALGVGASLRHVKEKKLDFLLAFYILFMGLPGVFIGASLALNIPNEIGTFSLGLLTLILGIYSASNTNLGTTNRFEFSNISSLLIGGLGIFFIGFINGSLSSGTGLFVTFWLIRFMRLTYAEAVAYTLILVGLFWNATGALTMGLKGDFMLDWVPTLIFGSFFGGYTGAQISISKGSKFIKKVFETIAFILGTSLILKSLIFMG